MAALAWAVLTLAPLPARSDCDSVAPNLTGFSFSPASVATTTEAQNVTCTMSVTDDLAGVSAATCTFSSPDFLHSASCSASAPASGTPLNGSYACVLTIPRYASSGVWSASVDLADAVGNNQTLDPLMLGFPSDLDVTSDDDTVAPTLTGFSFTPGAVTVSGGPQNVTCHMTLSDAKSGVDAATCSFQAPDSSQAEGCIATTPSSGTRNSGTFSCILTIPRYADAGGWTPGVFASDVVGNTVLPAVSGTLTVSSSPEDITAPSLTSFDFNPKTASTGSGPVSVTCTMGAADSPSGVSYAQCTLTYNDPVDPSLRQSAACTSSTPSSGNRSSGTFQCAVVLPRYSTGGSWSTDVQLGDAAANNADVPQVATLAVDCAGDVDVTLAFADRATLDWNAVAEATQYDVYRGNQSGLTDANNDHLPDGGYGTCQNSRDPDVTDTTFVDTDVPTAAQKGFFYLAAYKSGGVERGLGKNSFGDTRTVSSPCP